MFSTDKEVSMIRTFAALLTFLAAPLMAQDISHTTLENGLEVYVFEDHRAPVVVHTVWYRVGAADEVAGKSGSPIFLST